MATDVAARGLDVPDTHYVLNAEMPNAIEVCPPPPQPGETGVGRRACCVRRASWEPNTGFFWSCWATDPKAWPQ